MFKHVTRIASTLCFIHTNFNPSAYLSEIHWLYKRCYYKQDGCLSTIKACCLVVMDFTDFCFHSYFSYMDELGELMDSDEKPMEVKWVFSSLLSHLNSWGNLLEDLHSALSWSGYQDFHVVYWPVWLVFQLIFFLLRWLPYGEVLTCYSKDGRGCWKIWLVEKDHSWRQYVFHLLVLPSSYGPWLLSERWYVQSSLAFFWGSMLELLFIRCSVSNSSCCILGNCVDIVFACLFDV